ncbi:ankyrin repeat-containing domain protein [Trichophaea hybrida]|nr:ankyrin repeat-containing domain protein [Trichophaea hybrida]
MLSLPAELLLQIADNISTPADLNALARTHPRLYKTLNSTLYRRVLGDLNLPPAILVNVASFLSVSDHHHLILCGRFFQRHLNCALYKRSYQIVHIPDPWNPTINCPVEKRGRESPMYLTMERNRILTMANLLEAGAPVDVRMYVSGATLVSHAASRGYVEMVRVLLEYGGNPDGVFPGNTPLHTAAQLENYKLAKLLLQYGADREGLTGQEGGVPGMGMTPLQIALKNGAKNVARLLLQHQADPLWMVSDMKRIEEIGQQMVALEE